MSNVIRHIILYVNGVNKKLIIAANSLFVSNKKGYTRAEAPWHRLLMFLLFAQHISRDSASKVAQIFDSLIICSTHKKKKLAKTAQISPVSSICSTSRLCLFTRLNLLNNKRIQSRNHHHGNGIPKELGSSKIKR